MSQQTEYGPLGPGHDPEKDPMVGLRGVMAGTLVMQSISVLLGLSVVARVAEGTLATPWRMGYVAFLGIALLVMAFLQKKSWALKADLGLQVLGVLAVFVHWSMGLVGLLFLLVWFYILHLRKALLERMRMGLLTTQHT
ncbi:DUF4233 domain-containing protein [Corynebacterium sp. TAE3-ERU12]|uniref:DUF4233 domain-containing protein n=1 Tax=Corynebacterium sp. TAE3-ERU12 TaxID=2849491 RepID=UPI001C459559|nr:DUF4233 domain-containing protein [Corynebacterium sp. TAE3-ERU12]MBV7294972.1 DUF4233 domain-containing protein [Corynebacterium sp. TAE3-ERU12]